MATSYFSTNTELGLVKALNQSLTLYLPQAPVNGKTIFIKDAIGNSARSTIIVQTQGSDTYEDGSLFQTLNSAYESLQLNYNSNKWYITGGTMYNTYNISSITSQTIQTSNLSSLNISVSTLQFNHNPTSTLGTFNTISSFLYYNAYNIGGGLRTAILQNLNSLRFSPQNIQNLTAWYDGADPLGNGTTLPQSTLMSNWVDKSIFKNNAYQIVVGNQPNYNTNGFVNFNGANAYFFLPNTSYFVNTPFSVFIVEQRQRSGTSTRYMISGSNTNLSYQCIHIGYLTDTTLRWGFFANDIDTTVSAFTTPGTEPTHIWSFIYNGVTRSIYLNGSPGVTSNNVINLAASYNGFIGSNNFIGGNSYGGNLREIIITKPSIDGFQRQQTEGYLAWKWGLQSSLPATHPFKNAPPS